MIISQINNDGTTTVWNNEEGIHKGMHITKTITKVSEKRLTRLIELREFNNLSSRDQYLITHHKSIVFNSRGELV